MTEEDLGFSGFECYFRRVFVAYGERVVYVEIGRFFRSTRF